MAISEDGRPGEQTSGAAEAEAETRTEVPGITLDEATLQLIESTLGLDFVSYCVASTEEDLSARFRGEKLFSTPAEQVLIALADLSLRVVRQAAAQKVPTDLLWDLLAVRDADNKMTPVQATRRGVGGLVLEPSHENKLVEALQRIAVQVFPILLIPPSDDFPRFHTSLTRPLMSYPETPRAVQAISEDVDLRRLCLLPQDKDQIPQEFLAHGLIENIIIYAFSKVILDLQAMPSLEQFCAEIPNSVSTTKSLVQGKSVSLPVLVGLGNVKLPSGTVIESKAGRLSEYLSIYDRWSPSQLRNKQINHHSDRGAYQFNRVGDIVVRMNAKFRVKMTPLGVEDMGLWRMMPADAKALSAAQTTIFLAATLAIEHEPPIALYPTWNVGLSPLMSPLPQSNVNERRAIAPLCALTEQEALEWKKWISHISKVGHTGVEVAARRIQLALAERDSPVDRFVDSIIAWEGLIRE